LARGSFYNTCCTSYFFSNQWREVNKCTLWEEGEIIRTLPKSPVTPFTPKCSMTVRTNHISKKYLQLKVNADFWLLLFPFLNGCAQLWIFNLLALYCRCMYIFIYIPDYAFGLIWTVIELLNAIICNYSIIVITSITIAVIMVLFHCYLC
jgi:hypothetical protein